MLHLPLPTHLSPPPLGTVQSTKSCSKLLDILGPTPAQMFPSSRVWQLNSSFKQQCRNLECQILLPTPQTWCYLGNKDEFNPFTPEWSMSKFPCSLTRNMTSHSMENLTFHSLLRWKVIILQILATSVIQSLFERLGEYTFWAQEWKG